MTRTQKKAATAFQQLLRNEQAKGKNMGDKEKNGKKGRQASPESLKKKAELEAKRAQRRQALSVELDSFAAMGPRFKQAVEAIRAGQKQDAEKFQELKKNRKTRSLAIKSLRLTLQALSGVTV